MRNCFALYSSAPAGNSAWVRLKAPEKSLYSLHLHFFHIYNSLVMKFSRNKTLTRSSRTPIPAECTKLWRVETNVFFSKSRTRQTLALKLSFSPGRRFREARPCPSLLSRERKKELWKTHLTKFALLLTDLFSTSVDRISSASPASKAVFTCKTPVYLFHVPYITPPPLYRGYWWPMVLAWGNCLFCLPMFTWHPRQDVPLCPGFLLIS